MAPRLITTLIADDLKVVARPCPYIEGPALRLHPRQPAVQRVGLGRRPPALKIAKLGDNETWISLEPGWKVTGDAAHREVHLAEPPRRVVRLLPVDGDVSNPPAVVPNRNT